MPFLVIREAAVKGAVKKLYFQNFCQFPQIRIIPNHCIHTQRFQLGGLFMEAMPITFLYGGQRLPPRFKRWSVPKNLKIWQLPKMRLATFSV